MTEDKPVVVVTGCSIGGIGFALCEEFAAQGCIVYATARRLEAMEGLQSKNIHKLTLDVTKDEDVQAVVKAVIAKQGRIDVLVNNAGLGHTGPIIDTEMQEIQRVYDTNVFSVIRTAKAIIPHMAARRRGTIVITGSITADIPIPWAGIYASSKAAVHSVTETLYMECMPLGIDVVLVAPGGVKSNIAVNQGASVQLPPNSLYTSYVESVLHKMFISQANNPMPADKFAQKVVHQVLLPRPPRYMTLGTGSLMSRLLQWVPRGWVLRYLWGMWGEGPRKAARKGKYL
ncbi:NAD-P-binding protein [Daedaleopsis nitida]|nr:NAD-P-binding protein [Daedaleopsis nitida]